MVADMETALFLIKQCNVLMCIVVLCGVGQIKICLYAWDLNSSDCSVMDFGIGCAEWGKGEEDGEDESEGDEKVFMLFHDFCCFSK